MKFFTKSKCIITGIEEIQNYTSIKGSGSNYLSNEIFYRVTKMRHEQRPSLPTGHLHIPLTQTTLKNRQIYIELEYRNANKLTIPSIKDVITNIKNIIIKI